MSPVTPYALTLAAGLLLGGGAVHGLNGTHIAALEVAHADAQRAAAQAAAERLIAANARGDALTRSLAAAQAAADTLQDQLHAALQKATTGRACLGAPALRLLDRAAGNPAPVPAPAGRAAAADAADVATDTEVAQWAAGAYGQYAECARRLDALIQYHEAP